MRYLLPTPPIPQRFRRRMLAFGSGDPTKAICSTLIAQAFQSIRYPILPMQKDEYDALMQTSATADSDINLNTKSLHLSDDLLLAKRHFSHFTPRDFDLSPYFEVIKPTLTADFDYRAIQWFESEQ